MSRERRPNGRRRFRPRGSEIRGLIAELRELTSDAEKLRLEGADDAALAAQRSEIERRHLRLAEAVRRDPTFGRGAPGAAPESDPRAVGLAFEANAQRGLEHDEAVAATAVELRVSVHRVQRALASREPVPTW